MIHWVNAVSQVWADYIVLITLQNSLFLCGVFVALYLLRRQQVVWLRAVALIGLLKLFVVPVISSRVDRKSTRLNSSHLKLSRMPSSH